MNSNRTKVAVRGLLFRKAMVLTLLGFSAPLLTGCGMSWLTPEPPSKEEKTYTLEELEEKYRSLQKRPSGFEDPTRTIATQEHKFKREVRSTFSDIYSYKGDIDKADKVASKKEAVELRKIKVAKDREKAKTLAKKEVKPPKDMISAYY